MNFLRKKYLSCFLSPLIEDTTNKEQHNQNRVFCLLNIYALYIFLPSIGHLDTLLHFQYKKTCVPNSNP